MLATTGDRVAAAPDGLSQTFEARNVRDFTVTAATDYRTGSRVVDGTTVRVWYRPGSPGAAMLDAAADAFEKLRFRLGPYPYPVFKVVESAGGYGMESPGLIWIPHGIGTANLRYLAAHETAHQWFYGLVGNDQASQPFADEAAADFAARSVLGMRRASRCATSTLDRSIYAVHVGLLLRDGLHPGRQPARRHAKADGFGRVLDRAPRIHRGEPLRAGGDGDAAGRARCGDAAGPAVDDVPLEVPATVVIRPWALGLGAQRTLGPRPATAPRNRRSIPRRAFGSGAAPDELQARIPPVSKLGIRPIHAHVRRLRQGLR